MLSRYRIGERLGAGGMGIVLRAEDASLKRPVALKFLSGTALSQEQTRARFLREAQTAAALNHPNVCTIYEVGEVQKGEEEALGSGQTLEAGTPFLAMELVEGRTLEAVVRQGGSLPLGDLLGIAIQVSEGMAAAHARGIVHRDLKPGNVMVTTEGRVKILDFGLAKPLEPVEPGDAAGTAAATASAELTREGRVIGTAAYMSPEQAKGEHVDSRSDIFSFGVMLYELATGTRPFRGTTTLSTLAKIIEAEPEPIPETRADIPQELRRIVRRCLQKKPEDRYNDTRDLVAALRALRQETTSGAPRVGSSSGVKSALPPVRRRSLWIGVAVGVAILVVAVSLYLAPGSARRPPPIQSSHRQVTFTGDATLPALSPDGQFVAFLSSGEGRRVFVQDLKGGEPLEVARGFSDPLAPAPPVWAPDGSRLLVRLCTSPSQSSCATLVIPRLGGGSTQQFEYLDAMSWSGDGTRVIGCVPINRIRSINLSDAASQDISVTIEDGFVVGVGVSPRNEILALQVYKNIHDSSLWTVPTQGGSPHPVAHGMRGFYGWCWSPPGDALYYLVSQGRVSDLWKVPVAPESGKRSGDPSLVLAGLQTSTSISVSGDGRLLAYSRASTSGSNLFAFELEDGGRSSTVAGEQPLTAGTLQHESPRVSPDGRRLVFSRGDGSTSNIFTMPLSGGPVTQVTFLKSRNTHPVWSPDGRTIAFISTDGREASVWRVPAEGGSPQPFAGARVSTDSSPIDWAPGKRILYCTAELGNIAALDPDSGTSSPLFSETPGRKFAPRYAPDGRRVAFYQRATSGSRPVREVWVVEATGGTPRLLAPIAGFPIGWSADGASLYVQHMGQGTIQRVALDGGRVEDLFQPRKGLSWGEFAVSPDGTTFVSTGGADTNDVWLVENFDPEVR